MLVVNLNYVYLVIYDVYVYAYVSVLFLLFVKEWCFK